MPSTAVTHRPAIILVRPKYAENIGAAARIAYNFNMSKLIVVTDDEYDQEKMLKMATHKAAHIIHAMETFATTEEAAGPYQFIVATTARQGRQRPQEMTPRQVMKEFAPLTFSGPTAMMFGSESTGLKNEDVDLCQFTSTIPTSGFSSLNLAQAVAIHCYELFTSLPGDLINPQDSQEYANSFDLEGMYDHLEEALGEITFLQETNRIYWMRNMRQFLSRIKLKKREASMIRGICRKFIWHSKEKMVSSEEK